MTPEPISTWARGTFTVFPGYYAIATNALTEQEVAAELDLLHTITRGRVCLAAREVEGTLQLCRRDPLSAHDCWTAGLDAAMDGLTRGVA